ncbi:MAG TPA: ABC transporter permease [Thermoanaerobaculia bacterium]|nr:ABC transporter permease [Thermoanaerobaculia bacterium]
MSGVVIWETMRRHSANLVIVLFAVITAGVGALVGGLSGPARAWHTFIILFSILLGAQLIGPEFSSGTLQLILARPINRAVYLISRVLGVACVLWVCIAVTFALDAGGRLWIADRGDPQWGTLAGAAVALAIYVLHVCSTLAFFGTFTRSYYNAGLYLVLQAFIAMLISTVGSIMSGAFSDLRRLTAFFKENPSILQALRAIERNVFPSLAPDLSRDWALLVLSNSLVLLFLACVLFRRREVPYGAD